MLSRAATSLALLGRHLERADNLARILSVHVALSLDRADEPGASFWVRFMELAGWPASTVERRDQAIEHIVTSPSGNSVRASIAAARRAAQAVRPSLPTELYEQVNSLHWRVQGETWQRDLYPSLTDVQLTVRLVDGLLEDTMSHDEARDFVRLGKFVERAANVTTLVTHKAAELAEADDTLEWTAVLKCSFAFESYQSRYSAPVSPERVIEFLLLDTALPRSARFAAGVALGSVSRIDAGGRRSRPRRLLARLDSVLGQADPSLVALHPRELETHVRAVLRQLEVALRDTYFHPSKVSGTILGDGGRALPQQQQQQSVGPILTAASARQAP